jgi:PIN domain nuclease of toxin-antitoxin system
MIVIDTHIWVWWVDDNSLLTRKHRRWLEEFQSQSLGVSIVSCWEVAKLVEKIRKNSPLHPERAIQN